MVTCPSCRSQNVSLTGIKPIDFEGFSTSSKSFEVLRCAACDSMFLDPQPTLADTQQFYSGDYMSKAAVGTAFQLMVGLWDNITARGFAKKFGRSAAVLDFGSGDGSFVKKLTDVGCRDVCGYEPMSIKPDNAGTIYNDLQALVESGKKFDIIRMHNTIEHLVDIDETMSKLRALLKPSGCVFGETANGAHFSSRLFGAYWGYLHYPYHTVLFSPKGLDIAAKRWGYANAQTYDTLTPGAWAFTLEHAAKQWLGIRQRGHLKVYPLMLIASAPPVLLDKVLPGRTTGMSFCLNT